MVSPCGPRTARGACGWASIAPTDPDGPDDPRGPETPGSSVPAAPTGRRRGRTVWSSPRAVEIDRLRTAAETLPEIRQERVDAIREQIRLGRYGVDAEKLARLLVDADVL